MLRRVLARGPLRGAARAALGSRNVPSALPAVAVPRTAQIAAPLRMLALSAPTRRSFSTGNLDLVLRQADSTLATVAKAQDLIMAATWNDIDAEALEEMVEGVGRGRDLVNSLSAEEGAAAEAEKGLLTAVEGAEARLAAAIKCDELAHEAKDLRMEMEDVGTTGDGDNKPESFQKQWEVRFDVLMQSYAELLENCDASFIGKVERDCGYQMLLLKRVVHVDYFRYSFPKVHPSGFSASAD